MSIAYGQDIIWTARDGSKVIIGFSGYPTMEEARRVAIKAVIDMGWTPPRWWQFWRWRDTRFSAAEIEAALASTSRTQAEAEAGRSEG